MRFDVTASPESMYKIYNFLNKEYNSQIQKNWTNGWRKQFLQLEGKDEKVAWSLIPVRAVIGATVRRPCNRPITVLWLNQQALTCELLTDTALSVSHSSIHCNNNVYNYKTKDTLKRARSSFKSGCKLRQDREELCDSPALKASV